MTALSLEHHAILPPAVIISTVLRSHRMMQVLDGALQSFDVSVID